MIIISGGFPKSASTLLFLYTEELLHRSGKDKAQVYFSRKNPERFIFSFGLWNSCWLILQTILRGDIVVKTHSAPTFFVRMMISLGFAKAYYSIRDPRDVVISALDHARKARGKTEKDPSDHAFAAFHNREELYPALEMHFSRYMKWKKYGKVKFIRYEELLTNPVKELTSMVHWLRRPGWEQQIGRMVDEFERKKEHTRNFNTGKLHRFRDELSNEDVQEIERRIPAIFREMNYRMMSETA